MSAKELKYISGTPIRRQYFNIPICLLLLIYLLTCELAVFSAIFDKQFHLQKCLNEIGANTVYVSFLVLPLVVLSLFNRRLFGKTVGVITNGELHYIGGSIKFEDILSVNYYFLEMGRTVYRPAYVEVVCKIKR